MKKIFAFSVFLFIFLSPISTIHAETVDSTEPTVYLFGRDDCDFCKKEFKYLYDEDIQYKYFNITSDEHAKILYNQLTAKHGISKIMPVTVIGETIIIGYNSERTTGESIAQAIEKARTSDIKTVEEHIARAPKQGVEVRNDCTGPECESGQTEFIFNLPILGVVDLQTFSLFSLSMILGLVAVFNPCAMSIFIIFLAMISQAGSTRKMIFLAGVFIAAESLIFNIFLTVGYKSWNFVTIGHYIMPLVGVLSLCGALFFLWCWYRNKETTLICDITNFDTNMKTIDRFKEIANKPITIVSIAVILLIAFSINTIQFACSLGIPAAYAKILEHSMPPLLERQWYIFVYTIGYLFGGIAVFGLVILGYSTLQAQGRKYVRLVLLSSSISMLILGLILIINPTLLIL